MQTMVRWMAASLALVSLCTPAIGKNYSKTTCPGPELPGGICLTDMGFTKLTDLNSIKNATDIAKLYGIELPATENDADLGGSARVDVDRDAPAKMARCQLELNTVKLNLAPDPHAYFFPNCVRLNQCNGCCPHPLLTCLPTKTETVVLKVWKITSGSIEVTEVEATQHVECLCDCIVTEEDCNPDIHDYVPKDCGCVCKDQEKREECLKQNDIKKWINRTCTCECWNVQECGSGEHWNPDTCKCERD